MGARTFDASRLGLVVERCYDAVILPDLWPAVLQDFAEAANATGVIGFRFGSDSQKSMFLCSRSLEESVDTYVKDGWFARNPRIVRAARVSSPNRLVSDQDLAGMGDSLDVADKAWRYDFLHRQGLGWFAGTDFFYNGGTDRVGISIERSVKLEPFQGAELEVMHRALAHVRRALSLAPALDDAASRGLLAGLETSGQAAGLLDRSGRVVLLNARAEGIIGRALHLRDGRLSAGNPQVDARLQRFIGSLVRQGARCDDDPINLVVLPQAQGRSVIVRGAPIATIGSELFKRAVAYIAFAEVGQTPTPEEGALREAFELTRSEAKIARAIVEGRDVGQIAKLQSVSTATIRTHLKAIFAKTGTRRQTELAMLIASLGPTHPR